MPDKEPTRLNWYGVAGLCVLCCSASFAVYCVITVLEAIG